MRDGQPEYVSSNVASELFGNYLVTKGVLSDGELAMALAMMPHYGGKLGDTLVGLGLLKPLEVFRHLTRQVRSKIIDVCTWNKGASAGTPGRENPREAFPLDFNAFEILGAGAMSSPRSHTESWIAKRQQHAAARLAHAAVGPERFEVAGPRPAVRALDGKQVGRELVEAQPDRAEQRRVGRSAPRAARRPATSHASTDKDGVHYDRLVARNPRILLGREGRRSTCSQ